MHVYWVLHVLYMCVHIGYMHVLYMYVHMCVGVHIGWRPEDDIRCLFFMVLPFIF